MFQESLIPLKTRKLGPLTISTGKVSHNDELNISLRAYYLASSHRFVVNTHVNGKTTYFDFKLPGQSRWKLEAYTDEGGYARFRKVRRK